MAKMPPSLGTSLTPGFNELLANWDQVLQSLDRVSAYTAQRAQEDPSFRLGSLKSQRPQLWGETPEGLEWQSLRPGGYPSASPKALEQREPVEHQEATDPGAVDSTEVPKIPQAETGATGGSEGAGPAGWRHRRVVDPGRLERQLQRQESQNLSQLVFSTWRVSSKVREPEVKAAMEESATAQKLRREARREQRMEAALECWRQAELRETLSTVFNAWRQDVRRRAEALQLSQRTLEAAQALEVQSELRRQLEASQAAQKAAEADAAFARMALRLAEDELASWKGQLDELQAKAKPAVAPPAESDRSRQLTDLSIKLARAEAELSETKAQQVDPLKLQLLMTRRQLEVAYALLNKPEESKGKGSRDRDLAITHLWQVLERLQPTGLAEEKKCGMDSPSAMSTPNLQSSLSLPSLSSASSPSVRSRSKPTSDGKRWTAPWS